MNNLGIDPKLLLAQVINFVLFFILFKKFVAGPFMQFFENEKKKEQEKESMIANMKKSEEQILAKQEKAERDMKERVAKLLGEARKSAELIKADIVADAEKNAEEIKVKAKRQLEEEKNKLYREVKDKTLDLSVFIVNEALKDYLDPEAKKKITAHILKNSQVSLKYHEN